jgi:electron transfer flavoprotein alpha/beta subunit
MKIIVAIKQVPERDAQIRIDAASRLGASVSNP